MRENLEELMGKIGCENREVAEKAIKEANNAIDKSYPQKLLNTVHGTGYRLAPDDED